jgi:hypothetical protein
MRLHGKLTGLTCASGGSNERLILGDGATRYARGR